jgi:hypothetical protein
MDGLPWNTTGMDDAHQRWELRTPALPDMTAPGLPAVPLTVKFNDFDLLVMGVKSASEAYAESGNRFRWLEPRYTTPLNYTAGVCVAFSRNDFLYFGFTTDHRRLGVQQSGGALQQFDLPSYRPLASDLNNIALRIVRRGNQYHMQARLDHDARPQLNARLLSGVDPLPAPAPGMPLDTFRTLTVSTHAGEPQAVGMIVKTWSAVLCEAAFLHLEVLSRGAESALNTGIVPPSWTFDPATGYSTLPDWLVFDRPVAGPRVRTRNGRLHITVPWEFLDSNGRIVSPGPLNHWDNVDNAPKLLTRAPRGDFALATSARIMKSVNWPGVGGGALGTTMWGSERSARTPDVVFPPTTLPKQSPPPGNTYKTAYILVAPRRADMSDDTIRRIDVVRRYTDSAFNVATIRRRNFDSTL